MSSSHIACAALAVTLLPSVCGPALAAGFKPAVTLTGPGEVISCFDTAGLRSGTGIVAWGSSEGIKARLLRPKTGLGATTLLVPGNAACPSVAIDPKGTIAVAWSASTSNGSQVLVRTKPATGGFGAAQRFAVAHGRSDSFALGGVAFAADRSIWVVWVLRTSTATKIQWASKATKGSFALAGTSSLPKGDYVGDLDIGAGADGAVITNWQHRGPEIVDGQYARVENKSRIRFANGVWTPDVSLGLRSMSPLAVAGSGEALVSLGQYVNATLTTRLLTRLPGAGFGTAVATPTVGEYPRLAFSATGAAAAISHRRTGGVNGQGHWAYSERPPGGVFGPMQDLSTQDFTYAFWARPAVAFAADGTVFAAWDHEDDRAPQIQARVRLPGGQFGATAILARFPPGYGGDIHILTGPGRRAFVFWRRVDGSQQFKGALEAAEYAP